ncbi:MAG: hypothetical protein E7604_01240 [Ruminococcaceae bacterium]|nr:hypothetical protein [Oscillospiraceae bacterium]
MALDFKNILDNVAGDDGFDVKELAEKAIDTIKGDDNLLASFKENPIKVVEKVLKVDLPDEILEKIVEVVKTKINIDDAKDALGKIAGLFGKD